MAANRTFAELWGENMGDTATAVAAPQHLLALEHANRIRLARAELKRRVGAGQVTAAEVVVDPPAEVESMSISELLMSQRRWGRARCRRLLVALGVPENKRIGTLTQRQRTALAALLSPDPGGGRPEPRREGGRPEPHREGAFATVH